MKKWIIYSLLSLIMLLILIGIFKDTFKINPNKITIYEPNCTGVYMQCSNMTEVNNMFFDDINVTVEKIGVNNTFLNDYCIKIKSGYYSCGKYLLLINKRI